jgi:alanyl-tRNA synthetase
MDELLQLTDRVKQAVGPGAAVVLGASADGKAMLVANFDDAAVAAGLSATDVLREVAPIVDGGGGGKPGMARAGGKDPSRMAEAIQRAVEVLGSAAG